MYRFFVPFLLLSSLSVAQTAPSQNPAPESSAPSTITLQTPQQTKPAEVPESAAVITLKGLCPGNSGPATGPNCQTTISREQFDKIVNTLNPELPPDRRQTLAEQYARALILQNIAERQGIADTPHFKEMMELTRTQVLAQELITQTREKSKPTPAEIDDYYKKHEADYQEASFKRLYIPKANPSLKESVQGQSVEELKAEAEKIRTRLVAGEDVDKIEKEVYANAGIKTPPPPTSIPNWRRSMVSPAQASIFDLKPGEVSQPIVQAEGVYIYKMESKKPVPLNDVRTEIESTLLTEKMRTSLNSILEQVKTDLNQNYFGPVTSSQIPLGSPSAARQSTPAPPQTKK
ncbi:MAG TPA: peptidyl-prolyl cis-trans isomerase [Terriglobales bacterium]|nr:peptidyl-prolyl cis-trans isomerase [Terriglobales bacterium]